MGTKTKNSTAWNLQTSQQLLFEELCCDSWTLCRGTSRSILSIRSRPGTKTWAVVKIEIPIHKVGNILVGGSIRKYTWICLDVSGILSTMHCAVYLTTSLATYRLFCTLSRIHSAILCGICHFICHLIWHAGIVFWPADPREPASCCNVGNVSCSVNPR